MMGSGLHRSLGLSRVSGLPPARPQSRGQSHTAGQPPVARQEGSKVKTARAPYEIQEARAGKCAGYNSVASNVLRLPSPSLLGPEARNVPQFRTNSYAPVRCCQGPNHATPMLAASYQLRYTENIARRAHFAGRRWPGDQYILIRP